MPQTLLRSAGVQLRYWYGAILEAFGLSAISKVIISFPGLGPRGSLGRLHTKVSELLLDNVDEFRSLSFLDRNHVLESLKLMLAEVSDQCHRDSVFEEDLLYRGVMGPEHIKVLLYSLVPIRTSGRSASSTSDLGEADLSLRAYFERAISVLAYVLATWISETQLGDAPGVAATVARSARASENIERSVENLAVRGRGAAPTVLDLVLDYRRTVDARAPKELVGREKEIAFLEDFVNSERRVLGLVGHPKAGKTALCISFSHLLSDAADVALFLVDSSRADSDDYRSFVASTSAQFAMIAGIEQSWNFSDSLHLKVEWFSLLQRAAARSQSLGRNLVLLVDGLDEDRSLTDDRIDLSIASFLPDVDQLPANVKAIVTSRVLPQVGGDLPAGHWLRLKESWLELEVSPVAQHAIDPTEIDELMADSMGERIVGMIVAAQGPLTAADLSVLVGARLPDVRAFLSRRRARNLIAVELGSGLVGYQIGHLETVKQVVRNLLPSLEENTFKDAGSEVLRYRNLATAKFRDRIMEVARESASAGWPIESTPHFLTTESFLLSVVLHVEHRREVVGFALDADRAQLVRRVHGGDASLYGQIWSVMRQLDPRNPDDQAAYESFVHLLNLLDANAGNAMVIQAVDRTSLGLRFRRGWVPGGRPVMAEELLDDLVWQRIETIGARRLLDIVLLEPVDTSGLGALRESIARVLGIAPVSSNEEFLLRSESVDLDTALRERIKRSRPRKVFRPTQDESRVRALILEGDTDKAEAVMGMWANSRTRMPSSLVALLAEAFEARGDKERASLAWSRFGADAEALQSEGQVFERSRMSNVNPGPLIFAPENDFADKAQSRLTQLVSQIERAGVVGDAVELIREAAAETGAAEQNISRAVSMLARLGHIDEAELLAIHGLRSQTARSGAMLAVVSALAREGQLRRAQRLAQEYVHDPVTRDWSMVPIVSSIARTGDFDAAEAFARESLTDLRASQEGIAVVVSALARAGQIDRAEALALEAILDPTALSKAVVPLVAAMVRAGDLERAESLTRSAVTLPEDRDQSLLLIGRQFSKIGEVHRAESLILGMSDAAARERALRNIQFMSTFDLGRDDVS